MELVKSDSKEVRAMEALEPSQQVIIRDLMAPRVLSLEPLDAGKAIHILLKVAQMDAGLSKMDDDDIKVLAKTTWDLVNEHYPQLTLAELRTAFKSGSIGQYGEWYGMCLKSINQWIKGYLTNEGRAKAIKEWNLKMGAISEVPMQLKVERSKQGLVNYFHEYRHKKRLGFFAHRYFDLLIELSGPVGNWIPKDKQTQIKAEVEKSREKRLSAGKVVLEDSGRMNEAETLVTWITDPSKKDDLLAVKIKEAALKWIFDSLIAEGKELEV